MVTLFTCIPKGIVFFVNNSNCNLCGRATNHLADIPYVKQLIFVSIAWFTFINQQVHSTTPLLCSAKNHQCKTIPFDEKLVIVTIFWSKTQSAMEQIIQSQMSGFVDFYRICFICCCIYLEIVHPIYLLRYICYQLHGLFFHKSYTNETFFNINN